MNLCAVYNVTLAELCALGGEFSGRRVASYVRKDKWPVTICIHFQLLESLALKRVQGYKPKPVHDADIIAHFLGRLKDKHHAGSECS